MPTRLDAHLVGLECLVAVVHGFVADVVGRLLDPLPWFQLEGIGIESVGA
jgi:hypothetical protein